MIRAPARERSRIAPAFPVRRSHPQVPHRALCARQHDDIGIRQLRRRVRVADAGARHTLQCIKIRKIRDPRQPDHSDIQEIPPAALPLLFFPFSGAIFCCRAWPRISLLSQALRQTVLILDVHLRIRHYADYRLSADLLYHLQTRFQKRHISPELVNDHPLNPTAFFLLQQHDGSRQLGEDTSPVDIAHQQDRRIHQLRQPHVDDIIPFQIDLRRTAGSLDDDNIILLLQLSVGFQNLRNQFVSVPEIIGRFHICPNLSHHDHLRTHIGGRLKKNRIHQHRRLHAAGLRLHRLGPSHFQSLLRHAGIQRHILRFERRHPIAILRKNAAESCRDQTLSGIRHRSLYHDIYSHFTYLSISCSNSLFSRSFLTAIR